MMTGDRHCPAAARRAARLMIPLLLAVTAQALATDHAKGGDASVAALQDPAAGMPDTDETTSDAPAAVRVIVRALDSAAIASEVNARITYLPRREGDAFRKGDVLVEFDCRRTAAEHDAAGAAMREAQANYHSQLKLLEYKSTGTAAVEQAFHQFEKASAEERLSAVRLESCRILAPFDGLVTEKMVQVHEIAEPNQPLIRIMNQNVIELVMMLPSAWLPAIAGATFPVTIDETGEVHQARVVQTTGLIDPVSQSVRVIAELVHPAHSVLPGMSGSAAIAAPRAAQ